MPVTIKLEKVVNDSLVDNTYITDYVSIDEFNNLSSQNENLKLLLSYNKLKCEEQKSTINELTSTIDEMNNSIENLKHQLSVLQQSELVATSEISEKITYLNTLYDAISCMELNGTEHKIVTDPKSCILRINRFLQGTKELKTKITDNKILIMTMCKILNCDYCKIIQSMKDVINENETHKRKYKLYEQFYLRSVALTNSTSSEFHRHGYEQAPASANSNLCQIHTERFDNWNKKMTNTRYQMLQKKDKTQPTFTPMKVENYRNQPTVNSAPIKVNSYLKFPPPNLNHNAFVKHFPPPQIALPPVYPPDMPNIYTSRNNSNNFSPNFQHLPDLYWRPNGNSMISYPRPSSSAQFSTPMSPGSHIKRFPDDVKMHETNSSKKSFINDELHSFSKSFENTYDWRNCIVEDGKLELLKSDNSRVVPSVHASQSNTANPPLNNNNIKEQDWSYESDDDRGMCKRMKWNS